MSSIAGTAGPISLTTSAVRRWSLASDFLLLFAVWLLAVGLVGWRGEFPINDDWSYATAVRRWMEQGVFHPTDWTSMPLLTNVLWGRLFCVSGFSFGALRLSTLVASFGGTWCAYLLLRELRASRAARLVGALCTFGNPLWFGLSFTFMTDVPFTAFVLLSLWLFARGIQTQARRGTAVAIAVMVLSVLSRQLGLFVACGYAAAVVRRDGWHPRTLAKVLTRALLPLLFGIAAYLGLQAWMRAQGTLPAEFSTKTSDVLEALRQPVAMLRTVAHGTFVALLYYGLFLLPLLCVGTNRSLPRWAVGLGVLFSLGSCGALLLLGKSMPLGVNTMTKAGVGPDLLRDVYELGLPNLAPLPGWFWGMVTAMAIVGSGWLLARLAVVVVATWRGTGARELVLRRTLLLAAATAYFVPISIRMFLDRYLLVLVPILGALLASDGAVSPAAGLVARRFPWRLLAIGFALVPLAQLALGGTHDWMERQRARWTALSWLQSELGVRPEQIDGGFEYHGLHTYDPHFVPAASKSWWWVHDDAFVVAMGPMQGYRVLRSFPVDRWLPPAGDRICVLQRSGD